MFKKALFSLAVLFMLAPQTGLAADVQRTELLRQIDLLTKELVRLQALLTEQQKSQAAFYPSTAETRYTVVDGILVRGREGPRAIHQELFQQLKDVLGEEAVEANIDEFRVGHVRDTSLENYIEGYVELLPGNDMWSLTLRRDGTKPLNEEERELFSELFVHEYAHVLLHNEPAFAATFTNRFWDDSTYRDSARAKRMYEREGYGGLDDALKGRGGAFVSGYALLNPDEDMAESFGAFVERPYPSGTSVLDKKIRLFYTNAAFVREREALRANQNL